MTTIIPITLVGDNLGKRHLYLNSLVNEAHKRGENFEIIKNIPERSHIDRLYKIDLASKIKNVDYIIQNLKDEDMLYVSRALKSTWLFEKKYEKIINPQHLEDLIYPEMFLTAVTKMQHWIHHNLNDEVRCLQFYQYYYEKNFRMAIKFLFKCSANDIQKEYPKIIEKIAPHYLKILCEKYPLLAKLFYDSLSSNDGLKDQYLNKENDYFVTLRHLLKADADIVLDITERYFNINTIHRFSKNQTEFIMIHHKKRFWQKPELYAAWLLNMQSLADNLNNEEIKELVIKLARAKYLADWFNYKSVEPLIKRVKADERALFKNKVFVTRDIGEEENEWPYKIPEPPQRKTRYNLTILDDQQPQPIFSRYADTCKLETCSYQMMRNPKIYPHPNIVKMKTLLDKLFDEYRFVSFGQTLYDIRKRITAESSPQNREFMLLVLVSKSGGRPDAIASLLELLAQHSNEPPNVRAAIIRSLVKRASVWRLPEISWSLLLEFGNGLGLDGSSATMANCHEGLHAVVIRSLILTGKCKPVIQNAFLAQFSTLTDYPLTPIEKKIIANTLPKMLFSIVQENETIINPIDCIYKVIITLNAYKIKVETYPDLIPFIATLAKKDTNEVKFLLIRLYEDKIARKQLFRYTFDLIQTEASYINALRHDMTVIDAKKFADFYARKYIKNADLFLTKLSVYFCEQNGLTSNFLKEFKANKVSVKELGRPLAFLLKDQLGCHLQILDDLEDSESKLLASAIRANAHVARPSFNIDAHDWKKAGAKYVANKILKCQAVEIDHIIENLLKWKRTARLALTLSKRTSYETKVFVKLATMRPTIAIKNGLKLIKLRGDSVDLQIWETIKPLIKKLDVNKKDYMYLLNSLATIDKIPMQIRPEYSTVIYILFKKISYRATNPLCYVEIHLTDIDEDFIENLLKDFLNDDFTVENLPTSMYYFDSIRFYIRILVKYLFLCKTAESQKRRLQIFGDPFLSKMEEIRESPEKKELFSRYLPEIIMTFRYNKVFLDTQYVSSLPVMEKVLVWMKKLFSIDQHFKTFAQIHLSMLYFKAVRQGLKLSPEIFVDIKRKNKEGVALVGNIFGKYIAREVNTLKTRYFYSIPELYIHSLMYYLNKHTCHPISSDLLSSMIKGILEESKGSDYRLGIYLLHQNYKRLSEEHSEELKKCVINVEDIESKWLASAYNLVA